MTTIHTTAAEVATLCAAKNAAYGDSVGKSAEMLKLLYPHGLSPDQYLDALFAARNFDKRSRLAQGAEQHGEDPRIDLAGYALLELTLHNQSKEHHEPCVSASAPAAASPSTEPSASAAEPAAQPTTATASATSVPPSMPPSKPKSSDDSSKAQSVEDEAALADLSVAGLLAQGQEWNREKRCAWCGNNWGIAYFYEAILGSGFFFDTDPCRESFSRRVSQP